MACINNVVNSLNLGEGLSILPLVRKLYQPIGQDHATQISYLLAGATTIPKRVGTWATVVWGVHTRVVAFNLVEDCVTVEAS
jgi:hypothetical protein